MTSPAQQINRDSQRERLHEGIVPKTLRARCIMLVDAMPRGEARNHAYRWVRQSGRSRSELERFAERMEAAR
jgi:hypothetical protein